MKSDAILQAILELVLGDRNRPDSIEFGPANNRKKVYVDAEREDEAIELIRTMKRLGREAESEETSPRPSNGGQA